MKTFLAIVMVVFVSQASPAQTVLTGSFTRRGSNQAHDLKATLTPDGPKQWKTVYDFQWGGKPVQYTGILTGNIQTGEFEGTAATKDGKRTWKLKGKANNGVLEFDHWETTPKREGPTGRATLQPAAK